MAAIPRTVAVITTLDNLPTLQDQLSVLRNEPLEGIVIVINGSRDGTYEWCLDSDLQGEGIEIINRENKGAGPGRNAGIDMALDMGAEYLYFLDGGIRPLIHSTTRMLDFLIKRPSVDVIGVEIANMVTSKEDAWRIWPFPITDDQVYRNTRLSHTAYCMTRARAFDGIRFCEIGPFGEAGWGADDDELAYQWNDAGIVVNVCTAVKPYRRASGSFRRLYEETGVWPSSYGSVYEKRVVWLQQNWAKYQPGVQWGEPTPQRTTFITHKGNVAETAKAIKAEHDRYRMDRLPAPWDAYWSPYRIVVRCSYSDIDFIKWAEPRRLRQHHGDTIVVDGEIIKREACCNEDTWTGDFILEVLWP